MPRARTVRAPRAKPRPQQSHQSPLVPCSVESWLKNPRSSPKSKQRSKGTQHRDPNIRRIRKSRLGDLSIRSRQLRTKPRARTVRAPRAKPRPQQSHQAPLVPCSVESWLMNPRSSPKSTQRSKGTRQQRARDPNVRRIRKSRLGDLSIR